MKAKELIRKFIYDYLIKKRGIEPDSLEIEEILYLYQRFIKKQEKK